MAQVLKGFDWPLEDSEAFRFVKEALEIYYQDNLREPKALKIVPNEFTGVVTITTKEGEIFDVQIKRRQKRKELSSGSASITIESPK